MKGVSILVMSQQNISHVYSPEPYMKRVEAAAMDKNHTKGHFLVVLINRDHNRRI